MPDMHHLIQLDRTGAEAAYATVTSQDGITGWWTSRATVTGANVGDTLSMSFPGATITWDMQIDQADPPRLVEWHCTGGPPGWASTRVRWQIEATEAGSVVRLDHSGFASVDDRFRIVTVGWSQMLLSLKSYLETGVRKPFFDF